jgi:hypothetical protein
MRNFLIFIFFLASLEITSQRKDLRIAQESYLKSNYELVIKSYSKILQTKFSLGYSDFLRLGHSYFNLGMYNQAKEYYDLSFKKNKLMNYNHVKNYLYLTLKYDDSINYETLKKINKLTDSKVDKLISEKTNFFVNEFKVVDSLKGYYNIFQKNNVIYSFQNKNGLSTIFKKHIDSIKYQNLLSLDFELNQGSFSFSKDQNIIYISLNENKNNRLVYRKNKSKVKIYQLNLNDSVFRPKLAFFDQSKYNYSNLVFSKNFKKVYFISDRDGSYGSSDIYEANFNDDGTITQIKNLGSKVNTDGRESYLTIDQNENLYFSSNGHSGYGAMDIYKINLNDSVYNPINLGNKINSSFDDMFFNSGKNLTYSSSNRNGFDLTYILEKDIKKLDLIVDKENSVLVLDSLFSNTTLNNKQLVEKTVVNELNLNNKDSINFQNIVVYSDIAEKDTISNKQTVKKTFVNELNLNNKDTINLEKKNLVKNIIQKEVNKDAKPFIYDKYYVIVGSLKTTKRRDVLLNELRKKYPKNSFKTLPKTEIGFYRVSIFNSNSFLEVKRIRDSLIAEIKDVWIAVYN